MDYNNDGYKDFVLGDYAGDTWLYTGNSSGLDAGVHLFANGSKIKSARNAVPTLVDWDEDGYLDLAFGCNASTTSSLRLYMNKRTDPKKLNFGKYTVLPFWTAWGSTHQFYDLDRDGDKDLIFGQSNGKLKFAENTGTNSAPVFSKTVLISSVDGVIDVGNYAREFVCDWNEDGTPDLLVGGTGPGKISLFLGRSVGIEENEQIANNIERSFHVLNNPTSGLLTVSIKTSVPCSASLTVYDSAGRTVNSSSHNFNDTVNIVNCDISTYPNGFYQVVLDFGDSRLAERVVLLR